MLGAIQEPMARQQRKLRTAMMLATQFRRYIPVVQKARCIPLVRSGRRKVSCNSGRYSREKTHVFSRPTETGLRHGTQNNA